jgi:hypothetical protein
MGEYHLAVYPADWTFRLDPSEVPAVVQRLQGMGMLGKPFLVSPNSHLAWYSGPGLTDGLGLYEHRGFGYIELQTSPSLMVLCSLSSELNAKCPMCRKEIDPYTWQGLASDLMDTEVEPTYSCPCGASTPLLSLSWDGPPVGFAHFCIDFINMEGSLYTSKPMWSELEEMMGTRLTFTWYKV